MKIFYINHLFPNTSKGGEVFFCNNSLLYYQDDLFLMTFRRMEYHIPNKKYLSLIHPWKIWDNGFKFLHPDPDRVDPTKKYGKLKYRSYLSSDMFVDFSSATSHLITNDKEFDSTGMVILQYTSNGFKIVHWIDNLFGSDMNQDCRILRDENQELWLFYNGYFVPDQCRMMKRKLHLNLERKFMYLYEEQDFIPTQIRRSIEKNCVMDGEAIYYGFHGGVFTVIYNDEIYESPVPFIQGMIDRYDNRIAISLGTPPIQIWNGRRVAVGHVKIEFRNRMSFMGMSFFRDPFQDFLEGIEWKDIYAHGKYIYFMFLFEFNQDYKITRISDCFIPTSESSSHLPYLLTFPCGLTSDPDGYNFWLSFGEGDTRCKIMTMDRDDIDNLLFYPEIMTPENYRMRFLNIDEWNRRPKIFHLGYFFEKNCGDDMFRVVFQCLKERLYPDHLAVFRNHYKHFPEFDADRDKIIFGGGDIVNPYFLNHLFRTDGIIKDAVSIGIPYIDNQKLMDHFRYICLRSMFDYKRLSDEYKDRLIYFPDIGFLMPLLLPVSNIRLTADWTSNRPRLGVCLARTFYRPGNETEYMKFILAMVDTFRILIEEMDIYLIPFCTNRKKRYEDDHVIHNHILEFFRDDPRMIDVSRRYQSEMDEVFHTYSLLSKMDFMLCSRFHSHIFSIAQAIPFVSFSQNRKVVNLMNEFNLSEFIFPFENIEGLPIYLDAARFSSFLLHHFKKRWSVADRLRMIQKFTTDQMKKFMTMWDAYIHFGRMLPHPLEPIPECTSS